MKAALYFYAGVSVDSSGGQRFFDGTVEVGGTLATFEDYKKLKDSVIDSLGLDMDKTVFTALNRL